MDNQQQNRAYLEPIQEESEQENETEGCDTGEGDDEEEDFQIPVGVETKEVMAEDESEEDEDGLLKVMRPRRLSHSLRQENFLQIQSTSNHQEVMENFSESDQSTHGVDLSDGATPPQQASLESEKRSSSVELRIKNIWQKHTPKISVQKKKKKKRGVKVPLEESFPEWLVDLMVNIEEATTHQLVVE